MFLVFQNDIADDSCNAKNCNDDDGLVNMMLMMIVVIIGKYNVQSSSDSEGA